MKKVLKSLVVILAILMCFGFTACSCSTAKGIPSNLRGTYKNGSSSIVLSEKKIELKKCYFGTLTINGVSYANCYISVGPKAYNVNKSGNKYKISAGSVTITVYNSNNVKIGSVTKSVSGTLYESSSPYISFSGMTYKK